MYGAERSDHVSLRERDTDDDLSIPVYASMIAALHYAVGGMLGHLLWNT